MSKQKEGCSVCGGTDMNLVDGFYYCVECGTQDVNAQETVVEHTVLGDGTFAHAATRKFTTVLKDAVEMSGEWHKWHAFNFILSGLADEMMALGASPDYKKKVLWIWTRYMKEFIDKEQMGKTTNELENQENLCKSKLFDFEEDVIEESDKDKNSTSEKTRKANTLKSTSAIRVVTKGLLIAILYIALNLDRSNIQVTHLYRFIREGRLSIADCIKFVPKELNLKSISCWKSFSNCTKVYTPRCIRKIAMSVFKILDLGTPVTPDLQQLLDNYIEELCLPEHFKKLVRSLVKAAPCYYFDVDYRFVQKGLLRIPDFEGVIMSYILVALKLCFGLDDEYEIQLSDTIDKINEENNLMKSHKLGRYSNSTDRLFSFREWSQFLQYRKEMLCKYYLPMAQHHSLDIDDFVLMEQLQKRQETKPGLSDQVTMDILNRIPVCDEGNIIPRSEFVTTLTPLSDYTKVVTEYVQDPEVKLLLSEDFSQYSLKYACEELKLPNDEGALLKGVEKENKVINRMVIGTLDCKEADSSIVFIKNCENKNWLKTNRPTAKHITFSDEESSNDSDSGEEINSYHGYDFHIVNTTDDIQLKNIENEDKEDIDPIEQEEMENTPKILETIKEEDKDKCIFDDSFDNIDEGETKPFEEIDSDANSFRFEFNDGKRESITEKEITDSEFSFTEAKFNPETFDREKTIKELILNACNKFRIPIPSEYNPKEARKRSNNFITDESGQSSVKKRKVENRSRRGEAQKEVDKLMAAYYTHVERDILNQVSDHLRSVIKDVVNVDDTLNRTNGDDVPAVNSDNLIYDESNNNIQFDNLDDQEEKAKSMLLNDSAEKSLDSSVIEINNEEQAVIDNLQEKVDPNFDEKTHDIRQLYIKFSKNLQFDDIFDIDDPEIDKILATKIDENKRNDPITLCAKDFKTVDERSDSEDEIALSTFVKEKQYIEAKSNMRNEVLKLNPYLNKDVQSNIKEFNYWFRHYSSATLRKNRDLKQKFDQELEHNLPKSFTFVIKECAAIVDCTAFILYKHMQYLEKYLFSKHIKLARKLGPS